MKFNIDFTNGFFEAISLDEIEDLQSPEECERVLLPVDEALLGLPDVTLTSLATHYLLQGQPVTARHGQEPGLVRLYNEQNAFLGMGEVLDDGRVAPKRLMCVSGQSGSH